MKARKVRLSLSYRVAIRLQCLSLLKNRFTFWRYLYCSLSYCGLHLIVRCINTSLENMAAYSIDLRQKIVSAYKRRLGSQRALADVFGVSLSFVEKVLRRYRTTGELGPKPHGSGQKPHVDAAAQAFIRQVVHDHPDATLEELSWLADTTGVRVSLATMCRVVQRLALPRKKNRSMRRSATRHVSSRRGQTTTG
jgi:transposase